VLLDPLSQTRFVNELPLPERIDATGHGRLVMQMREAQQWLGLVGTDGRPLETTIWGYGLAGHGVSYPGPTIIAQQGVAIQVQWQNKLPRDGHLLPVDTSLHWADPQYRTLANGYVPTVVHLHGGHSPSGSDGLPEAWFTQNFTETGADFTSRWYTYPNDQDGTTLWYHDHALGITRLNEPDEKVPARAHLTSS
jgi:spore coat protein A